MGPPEDVARVEAVVASIKHNLRREARRVDGACLVGDCPRGVRVLGCNFREAVGRFLGARRCKQREKNLEGRHTHFKDDNFGKEAEGRDAAFEEVCMVPYGVLLIFRSTPLKVTDLDCAAGATTSKLAVLFRSPVRASVPPLMETERRR